MQRDWTAKIGQEAYEKWAGTVGRFGTRETNDSGLRLLEFGSSHKLTLAKPLYPHKLSRRTTWHLPNGKIHNQIDYVSSLQDASNPPSTRQTREHSQALAILKLKQKKIHHQKSPRIRFDIEKLKDPHIAKMLGLEYAANSQFKNFRRRHKRPSRQHQGSYTGNIEGSLRYKENHEEDKELQP